MIGLILPLLEGLGVAEKFRKPLAYLAIALAAAAIVTGTVAMIRKSGEHAGEAKVQLRAEKAHAVTIAEARSDERAAGEASTGIAGGLARQNAAAETDTRHTIEDLHHAIDAVPPPAAGEPLPAAPVDSVRASLNADTERANRAAEAADALP